jgi:hypothetical protein
LRYCGGMKKLALLLFLAVGSTAIAANDGDSPFIVSETGEGFNSVQNAIDAIGDGSGTILIAPGRYRQCGVQQGGAIAFVAREPGTVVFDGRACEGKAALVLGGRSASVVGLTFQNIKVPDGNGAGIRLQQGDLTVTESLFRNSQSGILSHADPSSTIRVDHSTFSGLGYCGDDCAHSIYIGQYGRLVVTRSRFERGTGGHYVKSRAARTDVTESSFDDSGGQATNYMIDLSNGGAGTIAGNMFVQGSDKENYSAMIAVAAEGAEHDSNGLAVRDNQATLAPGAKPTSFLVDFSGDRIGLETNRLDSEIRNFERR